MVLFSNNWRDELISSIVDIPVDIIIGTSKESILLIVFVSVRLADAILKHCALTEAISSTAFSSQHEANHKISFFEQYLSISLYCSTDSSILFL